MNQEFKSKNTSKEGQNIFKDSLQEYKSIIEFNNTMREKQFVLDGTKKDFELPQYDMLKDKYLSHYFISDLRSNQLVQSGLLKSNGTSEYLTRQQSCNENRIAQSKFNCLSSSQQLSKECKVYIDKYLKKPENYQAQKVKNLKIETNQDQKALPIILSNSSTQSTNSCSYAQKRNQIISLRFKQNQQNDNKSILNSSKLNSKVLSQKGSSKNFFQISPIPKQKHDDREEKQKLSKTHIDESEQKEVTNSKEINQNRIQENNQKPLINNDDKLADLPYKQNEQQNEINTNKQLQQKDLTQSDKFKQNYTSHRKFILKPVQQKMSVQQAINQKVTDKIQDKNNEKEIFYSQNELKLTEQQHAKVVEVYNKEYSKKQKNISQQSIYRLYNSNQPKKQRVKENNVIQTLSKTEFLEFLKQNNEKIRQRNKEASSRIGSKRYLQSEEDLDKKSMKINSKGNISSIPSCHQIKIEPQTAQISHDNQKQQDEN